jgi:predicted XRE-type DNA-binding protein
MTEEDDITIVHRTGNLFRDLHMPDADVLQARAALAVEIAKALDTQKLTARGAQELTGVPAADFSRIRKVRLERFTVDRLMTILTRINRDVIISVSINSREDRNEMHNTRLAVPLGG